MFCTRSCVLGVLCQSSFDDMAHTSPLRLLDGALLRTPQPSCVTGFSHGSVELITTRSLRPPVVSSVLPSQSPPPLLDICAKIVAENVAFQHIEDRYDRIPEPVQRRIIYWSFPRNEADIFMYSSLCKSSSSSSSSSVSDYQNLPFHKGVRLLEAGCVENVLQVGFHLSGLVCSSRPPLPMSPGYDTEPDKKYRVSVSFDRCKITTVTCSCDTRDIFWCKHVVALALYRIRNADSITLRVPISETLWQMDRQQLQKFVQYLISEHHTEVLPTAQRLADDILHYRSEINRIPGAPDPTAGACADDESSWHLDEDQVRQQVKAYLSQGGYCNSSKQLHSMFTKVREMLRARDSNGPRMLTLITEQFLADPRLILLKSQGNPMQDRCRQLWDQLGSLWVGVTLNPNSLEAEKGRWRSLLTGWAELDFCPLEDPDCRDTPNSDSSTSAVVSRNRRDMICSREERRDSSSSEDSGDEDVVMADDEVIAEPPADVFSSTLSRAEDLPYSIRPPQHRGSMPPRSVFHRAIECSFLRWNNDHLQQILAHDLPICSGKSQSQNFNQLGQPLWREHLPTACSRVNALRCHGYVQKALRLAVAIVRTLKLQQLENMARWEADKCMYRSISQSGVCSTATHACQQGWIGHPLDPIGTLFDTLAEASVRPDPLGRYIYFSEPAVSGDEESGSNPPVRYQHVSASGGLHTGETYLCLAVEATLIGLGQQRIMPMGLYAQQKACKHEDRLISKLTEIDPDHLIISVIRHQCRLLLDGGPTSGLGRGIHPESVPMHTFAKFLFAALLPRDPDLAQRVGLRAMRLPILEETEEGDEDAAAKVLRRYPRWFTLGHIESQQCSLASTMLAAAKDDSHRLRYVLEAAQRNIHSSTHLFKLAREAFRAATSSEGPRSSMLISAALELGLQVLRMTLQTANGRRREMVRWLVQCATEAGVEALLSLMHSWHALLTPIEATGALATTVMTHSTALRLSLDQRLQLELTTAARQLALQCATKDPPNCALHALTLCESEPIAFETAYQIVIDAASHIMTSSQLFTIARYMEHRGYPLRAYKLAMLAMNNIYLAYNQEAHPAISDIHWACALSHSLGRAELCGLVPLLVKNVRCAIVLSDVLRRCSMSAPGLSSPDAKRRHCKPLPYDRAPLRALLDAAVSAYVSTTHSRLSHISPRHYGEFIEFLSKARDTFLLTNDGHAQFATLLDNMRTAYKGKKKLMCLVRERFG